MHGQAPVWEPPRTLGNFWTLESMATAVTMDSRVRHTRVERTLEQCFSNFLVSRTGNLQYRSSEAICNYIFIVNRLKSIVVYRLHENTMSPFHTHINYIFSQDKPFIQLKILNLILQTKRCSFIYNSIL